MDLLTKLWVAGRARLLPSRIFQKTYGSAGASPSPIGRDYTASVARMRQVRRVGLGGLSGELGNDRQLEMSRVQRGEHFPNGTCDRGEQQQHTGDEGDR